MLCPRLPVKIGIYHAVHIRSLYHQTSMRIRRGRGFFLSLLADFEHQNLVLYDLKYRLPNKLSGESPKDITNH